LNVKRDRDKDEKTARAENRQRASSVPRTAYHEMATERKKQWTDERAGDGGARMPHRKEAHEEKRREEQRTKKRKEVTIQLRSDRKKKTRESNRKEWSFESEDGGQREDGTGGDGV